MMNRPAILATLILLAACGGEREQTVRDAETGEAVTIRTAGAGGGGIAAPANLPAFAPIYPGATITAAVTGSAQEAKGMVSFTTGDTPDKVIAFYRERATAAGLVAQAEANMGGARILTMGRQGDGEAALQLTVSPPTEGEPQQVSLVYAAENP
ncbi:hypothetical protein ACPVPU_03365 [Sphingomonas sp. CJ99]